MSNAEPTQLFDEDRAQAYDQQAERLAPFRAALHACLGFVTASLPDDARIACVGAGTGAELLYLALINPSWRFTAIDPAPAMLAKCRHRVAEAGIGERCVFHEGTFDTLEPSEPFDCVTSILVSHFLVDASVRRQFFVDIAKRLGPGGLMVTCDLATELGSVTFESLFEVWRTAFERVGLPSVRREIFGSAVGMLSPQAIERMIASSGFDAPVPFFQMLLMHGWYARRAMSTP